MKKSIAMLLLVIFPLVPVALHMNSIAATPNVTATTKVLSSDEMADSGGVIPLMFIAAVLTADAILIAGLLAYSAYITTSGGGGCSCGGCGCGC